MNKYTLKYIRIAIYLTIILSLGFTMLAPMISDAQSEDSLVYIVYVEETIEKGLHAYMERAFSAAREDQADHIIIHMNTPGGAVDAALDIGNLLRQTQIPITVFVDPSAISAGAYISLNADNIVMVPTATMGSATVVDMEGNAGDAKAMSMWIEGMAGAAEAQGRDPLYAKAMVDPDMEIEGLTTQGTPLSFNANTALEHGYAEEITDSLEGVYHYLGLENPTIVEVELTFAEQLARFITHPVVASILMSLASLGLILELYSPGFGIPGAVGLCSLLLFFFGHMIAGFAGWEALILFGLGLVFIMLEVISAGFGLFGILGIVSVFASLTLASVDIETGLRAVGISIIVSVIGIVILSKYLNKRGFWSKLVLQEEVESDAGEHQVKREKLLGKEGIALIKLRPAGTARIEGEDYDVVSSGRPLEKGTKVRVQKVEGTRIMVTEVVQSDEVE
ncbi:NfeD family protein [Caldalkalibacillus salinus]|uniref:NfeD family protein n=1 Tax=Caldalkalibacillus salinus TaxID=2803787 RepID=UPI001922BCDC|nr:nodulation protein NfeD [Caldalkalibacillus salinus]